MFVVLTRGEIDVRVFSCKASEAGTSFILAFHASYPVAVFHKEAPTNSIVLMQWQAAPSFCSHSSHKEIPIKGTGLA